MPSARINQRFIASIKASGKRQRFSDSETRGLVLDVSPNGALGWYFVYRMKDGSRTAPANWLRLGEPPGMTADHARELVHKHRRAVAAGTDPKAEIRKHAESPTVKAFGELYLATHSASLKPRTYQDHEQLLRQHINPFLGGRRVATLSAHDVAEWQAARPKRRQTGKALALLHAMMELAESPLPPWNAVRSPKSNPAHKIPIIKGARSDDRFDDDEMAAIWAAITRCELEGEITIWAAGCLRCVMLTGARFREMAGDRRYPDMGAHWDRLDADRMRLTLVDHKSSRTRGPKVLELPDEAVIEMQRMPPHGAYIFANSRNRQLPIGTGAQHAMGSVLKRAGIAHGGLHAFRRTVSDIADQIGIPLEHSAAQLGHARVSTTEGYQSRIKSRQARAASDAFAAEMLRRVRR